VEDQTLFAEAIRAALQRAGMEVVGIEATARGGVDAALRERPSVVLMDVGLPDEDGISAGRRILEGMPEARLLAVTAMSSRETADRALRAGFQGYLTKDTSVPQFVEAVTSILNGKRVASRSLRRSGRLRDRNGHSGLLAEQLTPREREVLGLLSQGAKGSDIATDLSMSPNTVRTHVQSILSKLQVHSRLEAVAFAVNNGIIDVPGRPPNRRA